MSCGVLRQRCLIGGGAISTPRSATSCGTQRITSRLNGKSVLSISLRRILVELPPRCAFARKTQVQYLYLQPTATSSCLVSLTKTTNPSVGSYMNMRQRRTERECAQHFGYLRGFLNGLSKACASIVKRRWRIYLNFFQNCTRRRISN